MSSPPATLEHAIALFNRRDFFECHEVLEDIWRPLPSGPEKQFLQGVIQVAVGFHHLQNGNYTGAKNLLQAGLEKLEATAQANGYQPPIIITSLLSVSREALQTVLALGPKRLAEFPETLIPSIQSHL